MKNIKTYLTKQFLEEIKKVLLKQEQRLAQESEQVAKEDPYLNPERSSARTPEFVEEAGEEIGHERVEVQKSMLDKLLSETRLALTKLKVGKYGVCENCKGIIDRARLEALPQARYCLDCEKKLAAKTGA